MDYDLAQLGDETIVGLRWGTMIAFPLLDEPIVASRSLAKNLAPPLSAMWGEYFAALKTADVPLDNVHLYSRAYCGWLLSNPTFVREQQQLLARYKPQRHNDPLEWVMAVSSRVTESVSPTLANEWRNFYQRWRLMELLGPSLPMPHLPQRVPMVSACCHRTWWM